MSSETPSQPSAEVRVIEVRGEFRVLLGAFAVRTFSTREEAEHYAKHLQEQRNRERHQ